MPDDHHAADGSGADAPRNRWPFGVAQTLVLIVLCVAIAAVIGWQVGGDESPESFNDADAGFLEDMIAHHSGAVALGLEYLPRQSDPTVAHFAREIVTGQSGEIAVMNVLVSDAGNPPIATDGVAMEWMGEPMPPAEMPGMATPADYEELRAATGVTADEVFSRLMIRHHAAGIGMARRLVAEGENPRVRRFARTMAKVQETEVAELNRRRVALGLAPVDTRDMDAAHDHMH
ncbi:MAG: DUF305 domain-containing protein [Actinobacteria bacterium]|nr:DUF305 domain-containing protein [Actinomycetota bacterium]